MTLDRRAFLRSAAATVVIAMHDSLPGSGRAPHRRATKSARIAGLQLRTAARLNAMNDYYHGLFGLPVLEHGSDRLTIGAGATPITFEVADSRQGSPFYHFAFNIPENQIIAAREWLRERTEIIAVPAGLRDPDYPDDVVHFRNWNAHSLFFFDPAENIVELIARHDLDNAAPGPFTTDSIRYASEIAFVVDDVPGVSAGVGQTFALGQYRNASDQFHAIGDEHGLLLFFKRGRKLSLDDPKAKLADVFPAEATIRAEPARVHRVPEFPYTIASAGTDQDDGRNNPRATGSAGS